MISLVGASNLSRNRKLQYDDITQGSVSGNAEGENVTVNNAIIHGMFSVASRHTLYVVRSRPQISEWNGDIIPIRANANVLVLVSNLYVIIFRAFLFPFFL
jgi:hypothetical protein